MGHVKKWWLPLLKVTGQQNSMTPGKEMTVNEKSGLEYIHDSFVALSHCDIQVWHISSFLLVYKNFGWEKKRKASTKNKCLVE